MEQTLHTAEGAEMPGAPKAKDVVHFRQILLWPVYLTQTGIGLNAHDHAAVFTGLAGDLWREVEDEFTHDPAEFQERHYTEFVTFLPPVQRFLYGKKLDKKISGTSGANPVKVMRRSDIAQARVTLTPNAEPIMLTVSHIDLYFFFDIDVVILAFEAFADDIPLTTVQEILFRFGRAYPASWEKNGAPGHCPWRVEWLSARGDVIAGSDFEDRAKYLAHVGEHRTARVGAHWEFLLAPLVPHYSAEPGPLRFRQLEYYRMPVMAFLAMEDPHELTRADYIRLALANGSGSRIHLPYAERHLADFEIKYCYDRYYETRPGDDWSGTRYMSCGHAFVVTGDAKNQFFIDPERGFLNAFRHQHFLLFLIAHFHKATLLMFSDRLAEAVNQLEVHDPQAVRQFRAVTRQALETFLRFTHRYWFHAVSNQDQAHDLFELCRRHLELDQLYEDIRQEVQEMSQYLEAEAARRQNDSIVRLTIVTTFGLIGTVTTGVLGMNLFDHTSFDAATKLGIFTLVLVPTMMLTFYTIAKSQRLFEFLDAIADERKGWRAKLHSLVAVWRRR